MADMTECKAGSVIEMASINPDEKADLATWLKMVEQLRRAPEWSEDELPIEMKQTHISVLLLSRNYVIKLKKPVDFGFLDYTTLNKRLKACEDEVRLNRRLCPDTYIDVSSVSEVDGQIRLSGRTGKIVDHCVRMKRLPEDRMLDRMVANNTVTEAVIDRVAARLSEFHRAAPRGPEIARWGSLDEIRHNWEENFIQTERFIDRTIRATAYEAIRLWVNGEIETKAGLFDRRAREGRIVDGHGDVRCESVCVKDDTIRIYDCIEFNDRFRCGDVASEAAFLAMDLDARGRPDLGYFFTEAYQRRIGDEDLFGLLPFYRCYRAYVRGKALSFRLNEAEFSKGEQRVAAARAGNFFDLALSYASRLRKPTVIAVGGLSGTGKTSIARALAGELGLRVISADAARHSLFGEAKGPAPYGEGDRFTARVIEPSEYEGAVIQGHVAKIERSGRMTGRTEMALDFDAITLRNGRSGTFNAQIEKVFATQSVKSVDEEGNVESASKTKETEIRAIGGAVLGAIIGGIAGGGKGAAIGAIIGAGAGAGSVYVQGDKDLILEPGTQMVVRVAYPVR